MSREQNRTNNSKMDVALSGEIFPVGEEVGYASDAFFAGCVAGLYRAV